MNAGWVIQILKQGLKQKACKHTDHNARHQRWAANHAAVSYSSTCAYPSSCHPISCGDPRSGSLHRVKEAWQRRFQHRRSSLSSAAKREWVESNSSGLVSEFLLCVQGGGSLRPTTSHLQRKPMRRTRRICTSIARSRLNEQWPCAAMASHGWPRTESS